MMLRATILDGHTPTVTDLDAVVFTDYITDPLIVGIVGAGTPALLFLTGQLTEWWQAAVAGLAGIVVWALIGNTLGRLRTMRLFARSGPLKPLTLNVENPSGATGVEAIRLMIVIGNPNQEPVEGCYVEASVFRAQQPVDTNYTYRPPPTSWHLPAADQANHAIYFKILAEGRVRAELAERPASRADVVHFIQVLPGQPAERKPMPRGRGAYRLSLSAGSISANLPQEHKDAIVSFVPALGGQDRDVLMGEIA